eukprot:m.386150 g.386150  ORF g.386150 m.386150 type:complete len:266 (+) comp56297_c0_seq11:289-1086(+)
MSASQEDPSERVAEVTALADEIKRLIRLPEQGIAGASEIVARASTLHQKIMEFVEQIKAALIHHQRVKDTRFITQTRRLYVSSNHMYELAQKNFTVEDCTADLDLELDLAVYLVESVCDLLPLNFLTMGDGDSVDEDAPGRPMLTDRSASGFSLLDARRASEQSDDRRLSSGGCDEREADENPYSLPQDTLERLQSQRRNERQAMDDMENKALYSTPQIRRRGEKKFKSTSSNSSLSAVSHAVLNFFSLKKWRRGSELSLAVEEE